MVFVDLNGDALHASVGLPPALNVTTAKVGKLEIIVSTLSYFGLHFIILNYQYIFDILSLIYFLLLRSTWLVDCKHCSGNTRENRCYMLLIPLFCS